MAAPRLAGGRSAISVVALHGRSHGVSTASILMLLLHLLLLPSGSTLEIIDQAPILKCSKGLTDCVSREVFAPILPATEGRVKVSNVELSASLCCVKKRRDCQPCLQIIITIQDQNEFPEESGDHSDDVETSRNTKFIQGSGKSMSRSSEAGLYICWSTPGLIEDCKVVDFTRNQSVQESVHKIQLANQVQFGSLFQVHVQPYTKNITIPSLEKVCPLHQHVAVKGCETPSLRVEIDDVREVVVLQLNQTKGNETQVKCLMMWNEMPGRLLEWPTNGRELIIPLNAVAPCLCFQVWWEGKAVRKEYCPFKRQENVLERMKNNLSVSLSEAQTMKGGTALSWTVTAPCRLDGDVWLCKQNSATDVCEEIAGYRQTLQNNSDPGWNNPNGVYTNKGEFLNLSSHSTLCLQIKVDGMDSVLNLHCPFITSRVRWSLLLVITLLLICLAILGICTLHALLKGYMWRWINKGDVKGAMGGGHVVLLCPPDGDQALPLLMCQLGSSLQALGFSVSLDLWSQTELSVLGPVPWLHSRLDRLQREGGKVVLLLTQASWARAEDWGNQGWERDTCRRRNREADGAQEEKASSTHADAFSASLSCILSDYLQGRAGERFVLVQFEALPPQPAGSSRPLPELFRGLHLYSLPSQSLGFLTELALGRHGNASARRRSAGKLRVASRALARGLTGSVGSSALRLAGLSQDCVGVRPKDPWEVMPLQPSQTPPGSSPDAILRVSGKHWV